MNLYVSLWGLILYTIIVIGWGYVLGRKVRRLPKALESRRMIERIKKIPWDEIDEEIKPLIRELNKMGLKTIYCCAGHEKRLAYVSISMENIADVAVRDLGNHLVFWWWKDK